MVGKLLGFLYKESGTLNQAALLLGLFSFFSQFIGFLRDRLLAHIFGASESLDIYYAAFRVPDFLFVTVASVVSLSVLIPFIIEKDALGRDELRKFLDTVFSFFMVMVVAVAGATYFLMPWLSGLLFRGFSPEALAEIIHLSRLLLLSPVILGLSNLFGSITQAFNRFAIYALAPVLYNAGIVFAVLGLGERFGVEGVAWGVVGGAVLHALVQVPFIVKQGLLPRPVLDIDFALIKKVAKISLPRTLTLSMSSLALILLVSMASVMATGSISILSFSVNLMTVPLSLIGVSYSLAAFPTLTRKFQEKNIAAFVSQMQESARFIIFWSLPFTALLVVLRAQVVRTLLGSGLFDWPATRLTAAVLALFVLSSLFQSLILLFMRGFYSAGHTRMPFYINLASTAVLGFSSYWLVGYFYSHDAFRLFVASILKVDDLPGSVILMLPLGFSIGTAVNCLALWAFFEREFRGFTRGVAKSLIEGLFASLVMGAVAYAALNYFNTVFDLETLPGIFLQGLLSGALAILAGIIVLVLSKSRELAQVWNVLRGRFWRARVIATDPEIV
jgi:putative peptidoglycan lipid II flippase